MKGGLSSPMNHGMGQPSSGGNQAGDKEQFNPMVAIGAPPAATDTLGLQVTVEMQGVGNNAQISGWPGTDIPNRKHK